MSYFWQAARMPRIIGMLNSVGASLSLTGPGFSVLCFASDHYWLLAAVEMRDRMQRTNHNDGRVTVTTQHRHRCVPEGITPSYFLYTSTRQYCRIMFACPEKCHTGGLRSSVVLLTRILPLAYFLAVSIRLRQRNFKDVNLEGPLHPVYFENQSCSFPIYQ